MTYQLCAIICTLAVLLAVVQAAPKSPWRRSKRETDECSAAIPNCKTCENPPKQCIACKGHSIVSDDGTYCVPCPPGSDLEHCQDPQVKDTSGKAIFCQRGFRRNKQQNTCSACPVGCDKCDTNILKCDKNMCHDRYAYNPVSQLCTICSSLCANCSFPAIVNGSATPSTLKCDDCQKSAYKKGESCLACGLGCETCSNDIGCKTCMDKYYAVTSSSNALSVECKSCASGCAKCQDLSTCTACEVIPGKTWMLVNGVCQTCSKLGLSNCMECQTDSTINGGYECLKCDKHHYLKDKKCSSCSNNCEECKSSDSSSSSTPVCTACPKSFGIAIFQDLVLKICDKCPDNCDSCDRLTSGKTVCKSGSCKKGYALDSSGSCSACPSDCHGCEFDTISKVTVCSEGQCFPGTVHDLDTRLCVKCPDNCCSCGLLNDKTPTCIACIHGFTLTTSKTCAPCVSNCNACSFDAGTLQTKCMAHQCDAGHYLTPQNQCANSNVGNCLYSKKLSICETCEPGFILSTNGGSCTRPATPSTPSCPAGCSNCTNANPAICTICANNLVPTKSIMCYGLPGCDVVALVGRQLQCTTCSIGYTKEAGVCHKCPANCDACNFVNGKTVCTTCKAGYAAPNAAGQCEACGLHCSTCTGSGAGVGLCDNNCADSYYFDANTCKPCDQSSNCKTCSSSNPSVCLSCPIASAKTTAGTCEDCPTKNDLSTGFLIKIRFCKSCVAGLGTCDVCTRGYVPDPSIGTDMCVATSPNGDYSELVGSVGLVKDGKCRRGYRMDTDAARTCKECPEGSAACYFVKSGSTTTAVTYPFYCISRYYYDKATLSCKACPPNCRSCSTTGICDGDGCKNYIDIKAAPDKNSATDKGYARDPAVGVDVTSDAICLGCSSNCMSCERNGPGVCDDNQCSAGYYYNSTDMLCYTCNGEIANCGSCRMTGVTVICDQCADNMAAVTVNSVIQSCHSCAANLHCGVNCASADTCTAATCDSMSYWDSTNSVCHACGRTTATDDAACACSGSNGCTSCTEPGFVDSPNTNGICLPCSDPNCLQCTASDPTICKATKCVTGFYFNSSDSQCYDCTTTTPGCATCDDNSGVCTTCLMNYRLDTGPICTQVACLGTPSVGDTFTDLQHTQLDPSNGYSCKAKVAGCLFPVYVIATDTKYCPKDFCHDGYMWETGQVSVSSEGNDELGVCTQCPLGCSNCFKRGGTGAVECKKDGCEVGYAKTSQGLCESCPVGCEECTFDTTLSMTVCDTGMCKAKFTEVASNVCLDCPLYGSACTIDSNSLMLTTSVANGFARTPTNKPFKCSDNCKECNLAASNTETTCVICNPFFAKNSANGLCYRCPNNCKECVYDGTRTGTFQTTCLPDKCDLAYAQDPVTKDCNQCQDSHCDYCENFGVRKCKKGGCQSEYYYHEVNGIGSCSKCIPHCKQCNDSITCFPEQCHEGFVRTSSGDCKACLTGCKTCEINSDNTTTTCKSCKNNHAIRVDGTGVITACAACTLGCNGCTFKDSTTNLVTCTSCLTSFYKGTGDGCTACGSNVYKCTSATNIEQCASKFGKNTGGTACENCPALCKACDTSSVCNMNQCESRTYRTSAGQCVSCTPNCRSCDANGCKSNECDSKYSRISTVDNNNKKFYTCERCKDQNCLKCDKDREECETCPSYYYLANKICVACPVNCESCDVGGCNTCATGWLVSSGQCANCPFHCDKCNLDTVKKVMVCEPGKCQLGYGLDGSKEKCLDCPTLTGIAKCNNCTDLDSSTNTSVCTSCEENYIIDENRASCLDCTTISNCEKCVDRKHICKDCKNGLTPSKNGTVCGVECAVCVGESCPLAPKYSDYESLNIISKKFCNMCGVKTKHETDPEEPLEKIKVLKAQYGCLEDLAKLNLAPTIIGSDCLDDEMRCTTTFVGDKYLQQVCCAKKFEIEFGRGCQISMSMVVLLLMTITAYALAIHG